MPVIKLHFGTAHRTLNDIFRMMKSTLPSSLWIPDEVLYKPKKNETYENFRKLKENAMIV